MNPEKPDYIETDKDGRLVIPPEIIARYNISPGKKLRLQQGPDSFGIQLPSRLAKLYIEPTSLCNLDCRTCVRNSWDEPQGSMSAQIFDRVIEGLKNFNPTPSVFIGGFGEPLSHPDILPIVRRLKAVGAAVEMITNGTLLTPEVSEALVEIGLDRLWVSIDGATPESYTDIRLGATLPEVLKNLASFHIINTRRYGHDISSNYFIQSRTKLGIAFVAMKRNIADLPEVIKTGRQHGAQHFMVTNLLPYTKEMVGETLYYNAVGNYGYKYANLPEIDATEITRAPIYQALRNLHTNWTGFSTENTRNRCPFIVNGAGAIRWDGDFSPCLPLMHSYTSYLGYLQYDQRYSRHWAVGNIKDRTLYELWNDPQHQAFRERVQVFDFAPCTACGACEMIEGNEEDCFGNVHPTCGGCLWAQGVIQCP